MGHNSIRSNLSKEDIIAEIRLTLSADFKHEKCIVIVEGEDDILFFNGKLQRDVDLRESFSGKCGVNEIVNFFSDERVIGICDIDYDTPNLCPQIFYYDYSCLEMMLISNDSAFSSFCYTYYRGSETPQEVRFHLLSNLKWLSLYRKLNSEHNWAINFKGLSVNKAFDDSTQNLNISNLLSQINKLNPGVISDNRAKIDQLSSACREEYDQEQFLYITQGHDFLNYYQALCESVRQFKGKSPSTTELFRALACSYHREAFMDSKLYKELTEYQITYSLEILSA